MNIFLLITGLLFFSCNQSIHAAAREVAQDSGGHALKKQSKTGDAEVTALATAVGALRIDAKLTGAFRAGDGLEVDDINLADILGIKGRTAIDRAGEEDLVLIQRLATPLSLALQKSDDFFSRADFLFWRALTSLAYNEGSPEQRRIKSQMLLLLARMFYASKKKPDYSLAFRCVTGIENPSLELARFLLDHKICDKNCFDRAGNSVLFFVKDRATMDMLLDLGATPRFSWSAVARPDRVVYFVIRLNDEKKWVVDRARDPKEIARVQKAINNDN